MSGIYCVKNKITKRVYVGKSVCIEERWDIHKKKLENKSHENYLMQQDYNNYGIDSFEFRLLEETEADDNILFIRERIWGQQLNSKDPVFGYNIGEFYTGDLLEEDRNKYKVELKLNNSLKVEKGRNKHKLTWEQMQEDSRVYMPEERFCKAYNVIMRYIINKTNLQTAMLYYILYSHYNHVDGSCFPSLEVLSIEAGVSIKTVQQMLKTLKQEGIIDYKSGKQGKCNQYIFPLEEKKNKKKSRPTSNYGLGRIADDLEDDPF